MKKFLLCLGFLLVSIFGHANMLPYVQYGDEWREATIEDEINEWAEVESAHTVIADFDSDGIDDVAKILLPKQSNQGFRVVSVISNSPNEAKQFTLEAHDEIMAQSITIAEAEASDTVWDSACEKGYWECEIGEIRKFKIRNPSIYFCYEESACKIFMWSHTKQEFTEVIMSD